MSLWSDDAELKALEDRLFPKSGSGAREWAEVCGKGPRWAERTTVHDWRNHVPSEIRAAWGDLGSFGRLVAFFMASEAASMEDWRD